MGFHTALKSRNTQTCAATQVGPECTMLEEQHQEHSMCSTHMKCQDRQTQGKAVMPAMGWGRQVSFSVGTESVGVTRMPQIAVGSVPETPEVPTWKG